MLKNNSTVQTELRAGMNIDWDVPIKMDDGLILRADVFRPEKPGKYPVILSLSLIHISEPTRPY